MRAFLASCAVAIVLAFCGVLALAAVQKPTGVAFATDGARINPAWSWRKVFRRTRIPPSSQVQSGQDISVMKELGQEGCEVADASRWLFVDFGTDESDACTVSQ